MRIGIGVPVGSPVVSAPAAVNPNLLTKTEQLNAAAWVKTGVSITEDAATDPLLGSTADTVTFTDEAGVVAETSALSAASGSSLNTAIPTASWTRVFTTATLDIGSCTFSLWIRDPGDSGFAIRLKIDVTGGKVRCSLLDTGDLAAFFAWGAKLETGTSPTGDASTYGAVA